MLDAVNRPPVFGREPTRAFELARGHHRGDARGGDPPVSDALCPYVPERGADDATAVDVRG